MVHPLLPMPSLEQQQILKSLSEGYNVKVEAVSGGAKSTVAFMWVVQALKEDPNARGLILCFGKELAAENRKRLKDLGLSEQVDALTYHSLYKCYNNKQLGSKLKLWSTGEETPPMRKGVVLLTQDEDQDKTELLYKGMEWVIPPGCQQLVLGDLDQRIYHFREGDEKSLACYLQEAKEYYKHLSPDREWVYHELTISYRLTPNIATFVNGYWGTQIVAGNNSSENHPVEFWHLNIYDRDDVKKIARRIHEIIELVGLEEVLITAESVKSKEGYGKKKPAENIVNELLTYTNAKGQRRYNFHFNGEGNSKNCARVWTYCATKGTERMAVVAMGIEATKCFDTEMNRVNAMGVALSRSKGRLYVIHQKSSGGIRTGYPPNMSREKLQQMVDDNVVTLRDGKELPHDTRIIDELIRCTLWATQIVEKLSSTTKSKLLEGIKWNEERVDDEHGSIHLMATKVCTTGEKDTTQDLSILYGIAIPFAVEWDRDHRIKDFEKVVQCVKVTKQFNYGKAMLLEMFCKFKGVSSVDVKKALHGLFYSSRSYVKGSEAILYFRRHDLYGTFGRVGIIDKESYDEHIRDQEGMLKEVYEKPCKEPRDFMLLAAAYNAFNGSQHIYRQVGVNLSDYDWVEGKKFKVAMRRLDTMLPPESEFEFITDIDLPPSFHIHTAYCLHDSIGAKMDNILKDADGITVFENKYATGEITDGHRLQSLIGGAIEALLRKEVVTCVVNNYKTGDTCHAQVSLKQANEILRRTVDAL